jgi:hypothetical protein
MINVCDTCVKASDAVGFDIVFFAPPCSRCKCKRATKEIEPAKRRMEDPALLRQTALAVVDRRKARPELNCGGPLDGWGLTREDCVLFHARLREGALRGIR